MFDLVWMSDPTAWLGLSTLVLLEIVLGIDNLVFIAILVDKLPPHQRDRARIVGLSLALVLRLVLLSVISWIATLTKPLFDVMGHEISGRDLVFLIGGAFLLFKATMELHERLDAGIHHHKGPKIYAGFWPVIAQIIVLDAVFSIDSVVTAVGMVDHVSIMMVAVVIAILVMMVASKPLTNFVNRHPTVIVLCLGFLMMIGFALIADGAGFHIPKGYLYAAIGFSIAVEAFNQLARKRRQRVHASLSLRDRTTEAVLRLLGGRPEEVPVGSEVTDIVGEISPAPLFEPSEQAMIERVLDLSKKSVRTIMTPRPDVTWIDIADTPETIRKELLDSSYAKLIVAKDHKIDEPLGFIQKEDLLDQLLAGHPLDIQSLVRHPLYIPEVLSVLEVIERFKAEAAEIALVVNEFGVFMGLVTVTDLLAAIAGDLPDEHAINRPSIVQRDDGSYLVDGGSDLMMLQDALGADFGDYGHYTTAAGLVLHVLGHVPEEGEICIAGDWQITVSEMEENRLTRLMFQRLKERYDE